MHRLDVYTEPSSGLVAFCAATCILILAAGQGPAAAQEKSAPGAAAESVSVDSTQVGWRLEPSGRVVELEGVYRLLTPGIHAGDRLAAMGDSLDLGTVQKQYVLLDFWTSWCRPCIEEIPELNAFSEEFRDRKDVLFVSVNQDALTSGGDLEYVRWLVDEGTIEYPVLIDDDEPSLKRAFKIRAWPTRILIHPGGEILESPEGRLTLKDAADYLRLQ